MGLFLWVICGLFGTCLLGCWVWWVVGVCGGWFGVLTCYLIWLGLIWCVGCYICVFVFVLLPGGCCVSIVNSVVCGDSFTLRIRCVSWLFAWGFWCWQLRFADLGFGLG